MECSIQMIAVRSLLDQKTMLVVQNSLNIPDLELLSRALASRLLEWVDSVITIVLEILERYLV